MYSAQHAAATYMIRETRTAKWTVGVVPVEMMNDIVLHT